MARNASLCDRVIGIINPAQNEEEKNNLEIRNNVRSLYVLWLSLKTCVYVEVHWPLSTERSRSHLPKLCFLLLSITISLVRGQSNQLDQEADTKATK